MCYKRRETGKKTRAQEGDAPHQTTTPEDPPAAPHMQFSKLRRIARIIVLLTEYQIYVVITQFCTIVKFSLIVHIQCVFIGDNVDILGVYIGNSLLAGPGSISSVLL